MGVGDIDPGWIFGATGFLFGAAGFWRGRKMNRQLQTILGLLAKGVPDEPSAGDAEKLVTSGLGPADARDSRAGWNVQNLSLREQAAMRLALDGASTNEIAEAFGLSGEGAFDLLHQIQAKLEENEDSASEAASPTPPSTPPSDDRRGA